MLIDDVQPADLEESPTTTPGGPEMRPPRRRVDAGRIRRKGGAPLRPEGCRYCGAPVEGRRRTFCSDTCVHEWRLRSDSGYVRKKLYRRDRGRCAVCGLYTPGLRAKWNKMDAEERALAEREFGLRKGKRSMWDADHVVPVALGGGQCGLDGYRTLCLPCHRLATAELRQRLKAMRRQSTRPRDPEEVLLKAPGTLRQRKVNHGIDDSA